MKESFSCLCKVMIFKKVMGRKKKGEMRKVVEIGEKRGLIGVLKKQGKKWKREVIGIYINGFVHILMK